MSYPLSRAFINGSSDPSFINYPASEDIPEELPYPHRHGICQKIYTAGISGQNFSANFNSFGDKKKMSENGEIYTAGKSFTLPPPVTNLTSDAEVVKNKCS